MAFNVTSFFGGMAKGGSQILDENRAQAKRDKETDQAQQWEIAREGRQNAEYRARKRDTDREETDKFTSQLASFNYTPESITAIAAGGAANVKLWTDIALQHKKTGKPWDINLLVANKVTTDVGVIAEATNDVADPNEITTTSQAFLNLYEPAAPEFTKLNEKFDFYQGKADNATGDKKIEFQLIADNTMQSMLAKAEKIKGEGGDPRPLSPLNIETTRRNNRFTAMANVGVEIIGTRLDRKVAKKIGDGGRYNIGTLQGLAMDSLANRFKDGSLVDQAWENQIELGRKLALRGLRQHSRNHITGQFEEDTGIQTQYIKQVDALKLIGSAAPEMALMPDGVTPNTEYLSVGEVSKLYQTGRLDFGQTYKFIDADGNFLIGIYTGDIGRTVKSVDGTSSKPATSYNFFENRIDA